MPRTLIQVDGQHDMKLGMLHGRVRSKPIAPAQRDAARCMAHLLQAPAEENEAGLTRAMAVQSRVM